MRREAILCLSAAVWVVGGSGCAAKSLREANQRLKESNERLIAENNRLEEELAALTRRPAEEAPAPAPARAKDSLAEDLIIDPDVEVERTAQGVRFRIPDRVFFAPGQVQLSARGQSVLEKVARVLNAEYRGRTIRVDGHTDDTPVRKVRNLFPTNWELSTARACTVVRYLVDRCSIHADRIYPAGFAYYRPVANGATNSARQQNRRVEIMVLDESV
jgi:chemotaxis protein MotB